MRRLSWVRTISLALLLPTLVEPAQDQVCSNLQPLPGGTGYQHRSEPERCEGLYQSPVAGESLEFLSFVSGPISYDLKSDKILVVSVPDVGPLASASVNVRARALPLGTYYRMDMRIPSAKSVEWPLSTVVAPIELQAETVGVVGWIEKDNKKTYVPVAVLPKGKPAAAMLGTAIAILRSPMDIQAVQWRVWGTAPTDTAPRYESLGGNARGTIRAGEPFKLAIASAPQPQNLEIAAKVANSSEWMKQLLRVFVP